MSNTYHYKLLGLGGGISFLVMPLLWEFISFALPAFRRLSTESKSIWILGITIMLVIVADLVFKYTKKHNIKVKDALPVEYAYGITKVQELVH